MTSSWLIWLCSVFIATTASAQRDGTDTWLVHTAQGPVLGYREPENGLFTFYSIPYATIPTGPHKFKAPLPPPTWKEPFEAIDKGIICPQKAKNPATTINKTMQEDCLIANIYVPDNKELNMPVMVYVHGGGFEEGSGEAEHFRVLATTKKVIIVTFNYRVGIHGFLCLNTKDVPGNAGMKDQVALLRWVKKNIAKFGGNLADITISGCSAGSASVDLLMLSKTTKGLFSNVIACSGANVAPLAVQHNPIKNAQEQAKKFNYINVDDISALEEFYKTAPLESLLIDFPDRTDSGLEFSPCVERDIGEEIFIDNAPDNIIKEGKYRKLPMMYGFNNMEGLMRVKNFNIWKDMMNEKFSDFLPAGLQFDSDDQMEQVANTIKEFYFGNQTVGEDTILSYINYFTDVNMAYPMLRSVKLHVEAGHDQIYLHEYSFVDENTSPILSTNIRGAGHCDQNMAVTDANNMNNLDESSVSEQFREMKTMLRELWYNFITTGKPVPEGSTLPAWPAVGAYRAPHMSLGATVQLEGPLLQHRAVFWDDIYQRYYRAPEPGYITSRE